MKKTSIPFASAAIAIAIALLAGCKPSEPPPDIVKTQRDAMEKARGVEAQLQQKAQEQMKSTDEATK